jgi:hypothetical protein
MDEIEHLVEETYRHYYEHFDPDAKVASERPSAPEADAVYPAAPGVIYHIQRTASIFVLRTLVSQNIRSDFERILVAPEDYPSLRLLEGGPEQVDRRLKFFLVENPSDAEIIHDQLHNRRFPVFEELLCNLSDPGFSWWLTKKDGSFQISFTMSVTADDQTIKLGPIGDRELALRNFQRFAELVNEAGIEMNIQNEVNRVQFTDCEEFILEELKDVFEFGVITQTFKDLFKILARRTYDLTRLEETWYYLHELAAVRRFWIQIQFDLNPADG